jgi:hypothetical protein
VLMMPDICAHCGNSIYPNDERVDTLSSHYHFECAESQNIESCAEREVVDFQDILKQRQADGKPIVAVLPEIKAHSSDCAYEAQAQFGKQLKKTCDAFDAIKKSDPEFYQELVDICEARKDD